MFRIRALARAAPQVAACTRTAVTRRPFVSTLSGIRSQLQSSTLKCFSTSRPQFDAAATVLAAKLQSELQLEQDENDGQASANDKNVQDFLDSHDWELVDNEGEQAVKLTRKYDDETIEVHFTVADFPQPYGAEEEMDDAMLDEEDIEGQTGGGNSKDAVPQGRTPGGNIKMGQNEDVAPGTREELRDDEDDAFASQQTWPASVTVTVHKTGKSGVLRFELVAEDGEFSVQSVTTVPNAEDVGAPGLAGSEKHWAGPPFSQLDEELQGFFENYLTERGIDERLANIVPEYIDAKEQKEYLAWLKKVKEFVE